MNEPRGKESASEPLNVSDAGDLGHLRWLGAVLVGGVAAVLAAGFLRLPRESAELPVIARRALLVALPDWKTTEPVSEVVYGTRGFDTFGETFLLLAAVVSVSVLSRRREQRREHAGEADAGQREQRAIDPRETLDPAEVQARHAEREEQDGAAGAGAAATEPDTGRGLGPGILTPAADMTVIVRVGARVATPVLTVAAIYLCAWGYSPGGGFPAGAALSGVVVLLYAAFGYRTVRRAVSETLIEPLELLGAIAIIGIEVMGLVRRGSMSANWLPLAPLETIRSGGVMQAFSVAELLEVATGLILTMFGLLRMRHDWTPDDDSADSSYQSEGPGPGRDGQDADRGGTA